MKKRVTIRCKKELRKRSVVVVDSGVVERAVCRALSFQTPPSTSLSQSLAKLFGTTLPEELCKTHEIDYETGQLNMRVLPCQVDSISDFQTTSLTTQSKNFSKLFKQQRLPFDYRMYNKRFE